MKVDNGVINSGKNKKVKPGINDAGFEIEKGDCEVQDLLKQRSLISFWRT